MIHYFKTAFKGAGLIWNSDNEREVKSIVEFTINAAIDELDARPADWRERR